MPRKTLRSFLLLPCLAVFLVGCLQATPPQEDEPPADAEETVRVLFVGNNWEGTADVVRFDPEREIFQHVARLDMIPDIEERLMEIYTDPERLAYFLGIRHAVGEGNDQFVDDMYSTKDGRHLIVSRPSLRDVVSIRIDTGDIAWRFVVEGQRSDHMAISPDARYVAVSASTGNVVHILDTATGKQVRQFPSGDSPHENIYSAHGARIYHASIGLVYTPLDHPALDSTKGERVFQIVDAETGAVTKRLDMGERLAAAGHDGMSAAVRPMALAPDERRLYFQVSFFHGFVEFDLENDAVLRVAHLPDRYPDRPRELYVLDSAHHGIAMDDAGTRLCSAGTMSDYAAIVARDDFSAYPLVEKEEGARPYWATTSDDGAYCIVSWSGLDQVSAISYESGEEVATIDVGDHPQRVRAGPVRAEWFEAQDAR